MVVLQKVSPISTQDLWRSARVNITSLTRALLPNCSVWHVKLFQSSSISKLWRSLRSWEPSIQHIFCVAFSRSVSRHNPVSDLCRQYLRPHGLVFALIFIVSCETLYRQVCAFPHHLQSIEFTTGGLQSRCRNISKMIKRHGRHLS